MLTGRITACQVDAWDRRHGSYSHNLSPTDSEGAAPMAGRLVFDITSQQFSEQWKRFDWRLLSSSNVHRVDRRDLFEAGLLKLAELGYAVHTASAAGWQTAKDMHRALATLFNSWDCADAHLRPLDDLLFDVASYGCGSDPANAGTVLALTEFDSFVAREPMGAYSLLDSFATQGRCALLDGHSMLCIVESETHFEAVGGTPVVLADTHWER
jgi:hypothetical protein